MTLKVSHNENNKKTNETHGIFLIFVMLLQSCTVYKSAPISLNQAVQNQSEVKIHT